MTGQGSFWFGSTDFYNDVATRSARFTRSDTSALTRTAVTPTHNNKWTFSVWIKRGQMGNEQGIISSSASTEYIRFESGDTLRYRLYVSGAQRISAITNAIFRDTSNWYHIVCSVDLSNSTDNDKVIIYVNGTRQTLATNITTSTTYSSKLIASGNTINIGNREGSGSYFDGYMAEAHLIDGQQLDPTYFAETKNDVWIAKEYTGTYGNNGARLQFKQTGIGTASSSTIGADTSGEGHHFTSLNISAHDSDMPDSPENNFATYNTATGNSNTTISEGNLRALGANSSNILESQSSTIGVTSGKWYAEFRADDLVNDSQDNGTQIGVTTVPFNRGSGNQNGYVVGNTRVNLDQSGGAYLGVSQDISQNNIGTYADGDIIGVALDVDNSQVSFYKNGSAITNAQNASISVQNDLHFFEIQVRKYDGDTSQITANFGQDSTFAGAVSAGGNTDANGIGDFKYSVPSGYLALCSANLPDTTLSPNKGEQATDYFNTRLYDGDGLTTQNVTGVGFQPDWTWIKERDSTSGHVIQDSCRGYDKFLVPHATQSESTGVINSVLSDGFQTTNSGVTNENNKDYVSWNWKAGGAPTADNTAGAGNTPTSGSVKIDGNNKSDALAGTIAATRLSASTTAGFSIVTYTGNNGASGTIAHGLKSAPEVIVVYGRNVGNTQVMGATSQGWTKYAAFGNVDGYFVADSTIWNDTDPTSTVFTVGGAANVNDSYNYVAYCFHSVSGYSAIGKTYTGNSSQDGAFVYTGFRPARIMIKRTNGTGNYFILDNKRVGYNGGNYRLVADGTLVEYSGSNSNILDILSNGFKLRQNSSNYNQGNEYVYMAFAEQPFKFSNAR